MISIIIPAYKTQNYIEECLNSVYSQDYLKNNIFEVIVAVDRCEYTLNKILEIRSKYSNLKVLMMDNNYGLFITLNTLLTQTKYENIIKFDSDDIMLPNLISKVMGVDSDLVRFHLYLYYGKEKPLGEFKNPAKGVYKIRKKVYEILGGYQPWKCAADTEFLTRFYQCGKFKETILPDKLFYYRQHPEALTKKIPFGKNSLRDQYHKEFKNKQYKEFKIEPVIGEFKIL